LKIDQPETEYYGVAFSNSSESPMSDAIGDNRWRQGTAHLTTPIISIFFQFSIRAGLRKDGLSETFSNDGIKSSSPPPFQIDQNIQSDCHDGADRNKNSLVSGASYHLLNLLHLASHMRDGILKGIFKIRSSQKLIPFLCLFNEGNYNVDENEKQNGQTPVQCFSSTFHVLDTTWCLAHLPFFDNDLITIFVEQNEISIFGIESICNCFDQSNISVSCNLTATKEFHNINEINYINETYKYAINDFNNINYTIDKQERGNGEMALTQYLTTLESQPNVLRHSANWRLDHILDQNVSIDVKEQWIFEIKEIIDVIVKGVLF